MTYTLVHASVAPILSILNMAKIAFSKGVILLTDVPRYHQIDSLGAGENVATAHMMLDITHAMYTTAVGSIMPFAGSQYMIFSFYNVRIASFRLI